MKPTHTLLAASVAVLIAGPAMAGGGHHVPGSSSSGGSTGSTSSSGGPTSVPEPSDAALVLIGAAGIVIGRKLHARARRRG